MAERRQKGEYVHAPPNCMSRMGVPATVRVEPDKRVIYLETDPYELPSLREHVQKHTACRFDSPLWQAPSWTGVANGYLDLTQWGPPPWTELQWVTLRNVIELAEES